MIVFHKEINIRRSQIGKVDTFGPIMIFVFKCFMLESNFFRHETSIIIYVISEFCFIDLRLFSDLDQLVGYRSNVSCLFG